MKIKNRVKIIGLTLLLGALLFSTAHADLGDKPDISIEISKDGKELQDEVIICTDTFMAGRQSLFHERELKDYEYIQKLRDRHEEEVYESCFYAEGPRFQSWVYGPPERIAIIYPVHGSDESPQPIKEDVDPKIYEFEDINSTTTEIFGSDYHYKVNINTDTDSIDVNTVQPGRTASSITQFIILLIVTILIELAVAWIYLHRKEISTRTLYSVLGANIVSYPLLFILSPMFVFGSFPLGLVVGEIMVIPLEAFLIWKFSRGKIDLNSSIVLSVVINLVTFLTGEAIYAFSLIAL